MGEAKPRFGSKRSADVKLFLTAPNDNNYEKNPVYLHSQILRRFKCFEGKFSNRWSTINIAAELWVSTSHNFDHYLKCIKIMYGEPVDFPSIEECLAILSVAAEMSADECINKCMQYLEAVRWSAEEKCQIRKVLSCDALKLKISADLAARVREEDDEDRTDFVEKIICAMGEAKPRFGSKRSADVKLFLTAPDDNNYEKNPVYLHSQILRRFKCFEGKFSDRCSTVNLAAELWVSTSHNFDHYLKCIEIMYGEPVSFPSIEECLAILSVAAEMSADECINKCMQYLEAVRWSAEEESQIRKVLFSDAVKLKISADLAARVHEEDDGDRTDFAEKIIREMVSVIKQGNSSINSRAVDTELDGILNGNASRDFVDACERVLLQEFKSSIDSRDFTSLQRIFERIKYCNGGVVEGAFKAFCEDAEFMEYVKASSVYEGPRLVTFEIIIWLMNAIGEGKVIISRASRVSFVTTWLPIIGTVKWVTYDFTSYGRKYKELDKAVVKVVETLPPVDKKRICVVWAEVYRMNEIDITMPISVSKSIAK